MRAASLLAGGDVLAADHLHAAARLHGDAQQTEQAVALYLQVGEPAEAARCLLTSLSDAAIEDPRLAACLRQAGDVVSSFASA
jgi:hypothetical protein